MANSEGGGVLLFTYFDTKFYCVIIWLLILLPFSLLALFCQQVKQTQNVKFPYSIDIEVKRTKKFL